MKRFMVALITRLEYLPATDYSEAPASPLQKLY